MQTIETIDDATTQEFPAVPVSFMLTDPNCAQLKSCLAMRTRSGSRLVPRYIAAGAPQEDQVKAAVIQLSGLDEASYLKMVKARYKGAILRNARKAEREGIICKPFNRSLFVPDIVEINHSMEIRSGGKMKEAYLKPVEEMGGYPTARVEYTPPPCPIHYDLWWGAFAPQQGYLQGSVQTDEKLVAYINFRRFGDFSSYNLILGHGDYVQHGVMYYLHFAIMHWLLEREDAMTQGLKTLFYAGFFQGGPGLQLWKKKAGFEPALMATDVVREGIAS